MTELHVAVGVAVIAFNLVSGLWGAVAWARERPSVGFWYALRIAQVAVVVQAVLGMTLVLTGRQPEGLHVVYGLLPLLVSLFAETARAGVAGREVAGLDFEALPRERQRAVAAGIVRRETGIMAASALAIAFLALRAATTAGGF